MNQRVLVIDDAVTVRMYHRQLLEALGYQVDEAENGVEALEKALSNPYALFLVDVNMPKMDGYRFTYEVRKNPELAEIPVVMVSTEAQEQDRQRGLAVGANFYLVKPVRPEQLQPLCQLLLTQLES
ncbi:MAG: response regulator [Marinospirillum sp.]|uniref:response regulator n=1 Tax=Marinospirillum sp. TaxID=2183934 RepID=UPI001A0FAA9B|nr:response regulator [Marinospirillum sp.]MBE0505174.1 response regulator [Marinospirillum sp.]